MEGKRGKEEKELEEDEEKKKKKRKRKKNSDKGWLKCSFLTPKPCVFVIFHLVLVKIDSREITMHKSCCPEENYNQEVCWTLSDSTETVF